MKIVTVLIILIHLLITEICGQSKLESSKVPAKHVKSITIDWNLDTLEESSYSGYNTINSFAAIKNINSNPIKISNNLSLGKTNLDTSATKKGENPESTTLKTSDKIAFWALIISILDLLLIVVVRYHHTHTLKKIQEITKNDTWSNQIVSLVSGIIAEIEKPSGEELQIRLRKSIDYHKMINQLNLLLDVNNTKHGELISFINTISQTNDKKFIKSRLIELTNKIIYLHGKS